MKAELRGGGGSVLCPLYIQPRSSSRRLGLVFTNSLRIDLTVAPSAAPHLIFCQRFCGRPPGKHLTFESRLPQIE